MPIYEYYCSDNHRIYQFFARTLAQGRTIPPCPENPKFRMEKVMSAFAVVGQAQETPAGPPGGEGSESGGDPAMESAMAAMEKEFAGADENDPRAMARMMRRMAELSGEAIPGEVEDVVRQLEEGADPESLEAQFDPNAEPNLPAADPGPDRPSRRPLRGPPRRDPQLYDYP